MHLLDVNDPTSAAPRQEVAATTSGPRSLAGYLLLPRPRDLVKCAVLVLGFLIGAVTSGTLTTETVGRAVGVWAVLEFLVYPARYQVNDILGFEADQRHPGGDRGRLPGPITAKRSRVAASGTVAAVKVLLALAVAAMAPADLGRTIVAVVVAVALTAVAYELLRTTATGHTGCVPAPATPGVVGIWLVIGAGYAVRGVTGVYLAVESPSLLLLVVASLAWWAFGVSWVTSRWAVEATAYAREEGSELVWRARAEDAREHLLALVRWLPRAPAAGQTLRTWRPTEAGTSLRAPWHVAAVAAGGASALTGWLLADGPASAGGAVLAVVAGAGASALVAGAGTRRPAVAVLTALGLVLLAAAGGSPHTALAVVPWVTFTAAQVAYLRQELASLGGGPRAATVGTGHARAGNR